MTFDQTEAAFVLSGGAGGLIYVPMATNPNVYDKVSFELWVKMTDSLGSLGWVMSQFPDYGWSRAVTINDYRLGYASITVGGGWDSGLGTAPVSQWVHLVGVWDQDGTSTVYMNGVAGAPKSGAHNGKGSSSSEKLFLGGRQSGDGGHNAAVMISDARVYDRMLSATEVSALYRLGRRADGPSPSAAPSFTIAPTATVQVATSTTGFETGFDGWATGTTGRLPFVLGTGSTPSTATGPGNAAAGSGYVFTETSGSNSNKVFDLEMTVPARHELSGISFQYHMYGAHIGSAVLESSADGTTWTNLWSQSGNLGNQWHQATVQASGGQTMLRFTYVSDV